MTLAISIARPRSASIHDLSCMGDSLSLGYKLSISNGKYESFPSGYVIGRMQTVFETRRSRLKLLVEQHGSVAGLNRALGWEDTNARLYQIQNRSIRADRGTPYEMGDPTAREIEKRLQLEVGWMDTPTSFTELYGQNDPRTQMMALMEQMSPSQWSVAVRLVDALAQPANGTNDPGK